MKPVLCYGSVPWTQTQMTEQILCTFERKILRRIYDPVQYKGHCRPRWNSEIYNLYQDINIVDDIKIIRIGWAGHIIRTEDERIPKKFLNGKFHNTRTVGKTKHKMGGRCPEGHIAVHRNTRMERRAEDREEWRRFPREVRAQKGL